MILKYNNFLKLKGFKESQIPESQYFDTDSGNLFEAQEPPTNPALRAYWESFSELRAKQMPRIERAITNVVGAFPFFGDFLHDSRLLWDHPEIDTMATDGINIYISSEFCSKHTIDQLVFVLVHEIMHITLLHHFRMEEHGTKDGEKWNIAGDLEINPYCTGLMLGQSPLITPAGIKEMGGLYDEKYLNMAVEKIFDLIPNPPKKPKSPKPPGGGNQPPPPPGPPEEPKIGDYVRIKSGGGLGKISGKNPDGTWKIDPATKEEVDAAMKSEGPYRM